MSGSWTVLGIPRSLYHCQLDNFDYTGVHPPSLLQRVETFQQQARAGEAPHLILTGTPGIGKSHLGVGLYRWAVLEFGVAWACFVNVPAFCEEVKKSYGTGLDPFESFTQATKLVVLDDLFGRDLSPHEIGQIVYRLIDTAYTNRAAVVVNMNASHDELKNYLRPHEVSRILAQATIIPMSAGAGKDWRRK